MRTIFTRYGDEVEIIKPGTREGAPAIVKRLRDGWQFELYFEDMGIPKSDRYAFYGLEGPDLASWSEQNRMSRILKKMRRSFGWRTV